MTGIPDAMVQVIQLGAFGLLSFGVLWLFHKGIPLYFENERERSLIRKETSEMFVAALKEAREYHRQDTETNRAVLAEMQSTLASQISGLARAIDRNTIAHVATARGDDPEAAIERWTNGSSEMGR